MSNTCDRVPGRAGQATRRFGILALTISAAFATRPSGLAQGAEPVAATAPPDVELVEELVLAGEYEEALEAIAEGAGEEGAAAALLPWRVRVLEETGRGEEALRLVTESPAYRRGESWAAIAAGAQRQRRGDWREAVDDYRKALVGAAEDERSPLAVEARARLGLLLIAQGEREEGARHLRKIVAIYQKMSAKQAEELTPETYVWMGHACEGLNRYADAYDVMYSSALDLDPECALAHVAAGYALIAKYNYPDARSHFKDALEANPNLAEAHIGLAEATYIDLQYPRNRWLDTVRELDAADRVWPEHPRALVLRGHIAFYDEKWREAERLYRRAIELEPRNLRWRGYLAALYHSIYQKENFARLESEVRALHPAPAEFYSTLAEKLVERFFYEEAADFAQKAVESDPDYWPAYVTLGINALRVGREQEGKLYIEKAFRKDRFNVWAFNTRILIRHLEKNFLESRGPDFTLRLHRDDEAFLLPYLRPLLREAKKRMQRQYRLEISAPIVVEDFSKHSYFSARSIGLPGLAASGVCFGKMVTLTTPKAIPGNWGAVALHEFAHVIALQKTGNRVPRWFTEGLSVYEEGRQFPRWIRHFADEFVDAVAHEDLLPIGRLQSGFTRPDGPDRILLSYYQGGIICRFIVERFGFDRIVEMLASYQRGSFTEQVLREVLGLSLEEFDEQFFAYAKKFADSLGLAPTVAAGEIAPLRFHLEDRPDDFDALVRLGWAYYFAGRDADTELTLGKAHALKRDSGDLAALVGLLGLRQGRVQPAIDALERARELGTTYRYRVTLGLAMLSAHRGETTAAIDRFREAIAIHPVGVRPRFGAEKNPYHQLVDLLLEDGRDDEAVQVLRDLVEIDRDDFPARKSLALHYNKVGDFGSVLRDTWDAPYIDPYDEEMHQLLARAYLEEQRYEEAIRELEVGLAGKSPDLRTIYADLAWCHFKLGQNSRALDRAERALEIDPDNARAREVRDRVK